MTDLKAEARNAQAALVGCGLCGLHERAAELIRRLLERVEELEGEVESLKAPSNPVPTGPCIVVFQGPDHNCAMRIVKAIRHAVGYSFRMAKSVYEASKTHPQEVGPFLAAADAVELYEQLARWCAHASIREHTP